MSKLTDPKINGKYPFQYTSSAATDLAATFERIRKRNKVAEGSTSSQQSTVRQLRREK